VTVLIATHDLSLIARMPYRVMSLEQGQILAGGVTTA
jgi:cell division transport system ATP-binding protein